MLPYTRTPAERARLDRYLRIRAQELLDAHPPKPQETYCGCATCTVDVPLLLDAAEMLSTKGGDHD